MKIQDKKLWDLGSYNPYPSKDALKYSIKRGSIMESEGYHCGEEEYATFLEVGLDSQIDHRLFALCVLVDDLDQLLGYIKKYPYPTNVLVEAFLSKWANLKKEVDQSVKDSFEKKSNYTTKQLEEEASVLESLKPGMDLVAIEHAFDTFGDDEDEDQKENIDHKP